MKPLTPSIDFDPRVIAYVLFFRVILGHSGELFASASLGKGERDRNKSVPSEAVSPSQFQLDRWGSTTLSPCSGTPMPRESNMTKNYVKPLQALRAVMVEKRRKLAEIFFAFPQRRKSLQSGTRSSSNCRGKLMLSMMPSRMNNCLVHPCANR